MQFSRADLGRCRLYGILDLAYVQRASVVRVAQEMIAGGVDIMQLRAKKLGVAEIEQIAREILPIARAENIPLIVNDFPEVAARAKLDGVHLGQDDQSIGFARAVADDACIVGRSTHSVAQAIRAQEEGADYVGFGPLYATPTKPDYAPIGLRDIAEVQRALSIPIFCIGGIKLANLLEVIDAGAQRVVIVSGLLCAPDIVSYAAEAKKFLNRKSKLENPKPACRS